MPGMADSRFDRSVNVICVHDEHGALGIDIGHVREGVSFHEVLEELDIDPGVAPDCPVLHGGPVEPGRGFILHSTDWGGADTIQVQPLCALSASQDVLRAIAAGRGPRHWLMALGYAGWGAGQLEQEIARNDWLHVAPDEDLLFVGPDETRWRRALAKLKVDPLLLSGAAGRA